ncbi:HepT-like ribonuclease domain-containing protein [Thioalkalivibrio sp. ALE16]|uniref:HepT-like ribonuclease domain-containing protein n=1 Tax=Thioalkalivibrio sp. ALE16 TaxID=1158172 RepID=UPI0003614937|nr:HepT-like ribonuclease domain-containing protein [Thioalkalivibrio sp. ALE16]
MFETLRDRLDLEETLAEQLMDACAMRNVLTHPYDTIELERVIGAVTPALQVYTRFAHWAEQRT